MSVIKVKDRYDLETRMCEKGITRHALAEICGVHYSTIAYYITGQRNPRGIVANKMMKVLGAEFHDIFELGPRKRKGER